MDLKDWGILIGALGTCIAALKYFIRAEFNALKDNLDKRYVLREVAEATEKATHERLQRLEGWR